MYLIFTDESGNTGNNLLDPQQPFHYICGVYIGHHKCLEVQHSIEDIIKDYYGVIPERLELKGKYLFAGEGLFKFIKPDDRVAICRRLIGLLGEHDLGYVLSVIDKRGLHSRYSHPFHPHDLAFLFFLEMFEEILRSNDKLGLVVADEEKSRGVKIIKDFKKYKEYGTGFSSYKSVDLTRIIDNVHFVDSVDSWPLQLTDVVIYFINRGNKLLTEKSLTGKPQWDDITSLNRSEKEVYSLYVEASKYCGKKKRFP